MGCSQKSDLSGSMSAKGVLLLKFSAATKMARLAKVPCGWGGHVSYTRLLSVLSYGPGILTRVMDRWRPWLFQNQCAQVPWGAIRPGYSLLLCEDISSLDNDPP